MCKYPTSSANQKWLQIVPLKIEITFGSDIKEGKSLVKFNQILQASKPIALNITYYRNGLEMHLSVLSKVGKSFFQFAFSVL